MFATEARSYITSLIAIQRKIKSRGYERNDQQLISECIEKLETLLNAWRYATNELMAKFWISHRPEIRYLIPTASYKGFKALMVHFECLDRDSKIYQQTKQLINS